MGAKPPIRPITSKQATLSEKSRKVLKNVLIRINECYAIYMIEKVVKEVAKENNIEL